MKDHCPRNRKRRQEIVEAAREIIERMVEGITEALDPNKLPLAKSRKQRFRTYFQARATLFPQNFRVPTLLFSSQLAQLGRPDMAEKVQALRSRERDDITDGLHAAVCATGTQKRSPI